MLVPTMILLADSDPTSPNVHWHVLLTGVQTAGLALAADAILAAVLCLYLFGIWRLARKGRPWSPWAAGAFIAGLATVWVAVGSGLAAYDEINVVVHVVQHILLMMVAAPLLALGKPITLASQAARRPNQVRILKVVHSLPAAVITFPVLAWFLYYGSMYAYFLDRRIYDYSIDHVLFHDASHFVFLTVGYLYWQPLVGADPTRWRLSHPARILATMIGMPFEAFLGIAVYMTRTPIDPINTLANTRAAGQTFWILAMTVTGVCLTVMALQWYQHIERQTAAEDRRARRLATASAARAAGLGIQPDRDGWTVPPWRLAQLEARQARRRPSPPNTHLQ